MDARLQGGHTVAPLQSAHPWRSPTTVFGALEGGVRPVAGSETVVAQENQSFRRRRSRDTGPVDSTHADEAGRDDRSHVRTALNHFVMVYSRWETLPVVLDMGAGLFIRRGREPAQALWSLVWRAANHRTDSLSRRFPQPARTDQARTSQKR